MNHLSDNELLLLAYGETTAAGERGAHLATCDRCRATLVELDRARAMLDDAMPANTRRRAGLDWTAVGLGAAAVLATVLITGPRPSPNRATYWTPTTTWSRTAGYVTGGKAMEDIDAQLTQLEREGKRYYGLAN